MDTITHALAGGVIAYAVKEKTGWAGAGAVLAASLAPDIDMPLMLADQLTYLQYHRVVTNSIIGVVALTIIVAYAAYRLGRGKTAFRTLLALSFAGVALHVFMDMTNSYGCKLLWPFSDRWYALDLVFIVDPWISALLVLSLVIMRIGADRSGVLIGCFMLLSMYWGVRYYERGKAIEVFKKERPEATSIAAFPAPLNPFAWRMVSEEQGWFDMGWYNLRSKEWHDTESLEKMPEHGGVRSALASNAGRQFMGFARYPFIYYDELPGGSWLVHIQDLRFSTEKDDRRFVLTQKVDKDGKVLRSEFEF